MQVETGDLMFNKILQDKPKYDFDIFKSYFKQVDKVMEKGKITTRLEADHITRVAAAQLALKFWL
jgi:hypothetical protein